MNRRRMLLLALCMAVWVAGLRMTGCVDPCDEAVDLCRDCDVEVSTCTQRFGNVPDDTCERAVDGYHSVGCAGADRGSCNSDESPGVGG